MPLNPNSHKNLLISHENLINATHIDSNVDPKLIVTSIKTAQDLYLQPLLSTSLYVDLQTKLQEDTLNEDEKDFLEAYLTNTLAWFAVSELYLFSTFRQKNMGLGRQNDNDSNFQAAELSEVQSLSNAARNRAEQFGERMVKYIRSNKAMFPAYKDCETTDSPDLPGAKSAYQCPIFLD